MELTVYPRFWQQGRELLKLNSRGFLIGEITGSMTSSGVVLEDIHLPDPARTLSVKSYEEILSSRGRNGYEAISAPHHCMLTEKYDERMKGKNVIGYAGRCPILQPTIEDLKYAARFFHDAEGDVAMAFFHETDGCAIYRIDRFDLGAIMDLDVAAFPPKTIEEFARRRLIFKSDVMPK
jgi:hypothetical protein